MDEIKQPKISIIVPVYNCVNLVERALNSIPLDDDVQLILVDDGSTDGSYEKELEWWVKHMKGSHYGLFIHKKENQGVASAMNVGFEVARGEYIGSLSSDDYYRTDFEQFRPLMNGKNDLIYFDLEVNDGSIWELDEISKKKFVGAVKFIRREFLGDTRIPEDVKYMEDVPFNNYLQLKKPKEVFSNIALKHYNWPREGSLIAQAENDYKNNRKEWERASKQIKWEGHD